MSKAYFPSYSFCLYTFFINRVSWSFNSSSWPLIYSWFYLLSFFSITSATLKEWVNSMCILFAPKYDRKNMIITHPAIILIVLFSRHVHVWRFIPLLTSRLLLFMTKHSLEYESIWNTDRLEYFLLLFNDFVLFVVEAINVLSSAFTIHVFHGVLNAIEPAYFFIRPTHNTLTKEGWILFVKSRATTQMYSQKRSRSLHLSTKSVHHILS